MTNEKKDDINEVVEEPGKGEEGAGKEKVKSQFDAAAELRNQIDIYELRKKLRGQIAAEIADVTLSPEAIWFQNLKIRFDALPQLHPDIQWADVERSLKADPESVKKLQALDEKGHSTNVFGQQYGELIFVSAWLSTDELKGDHSEIAYNEEVENWYKGALQRGYAKGKCNGNVIAIAKSLGVKIAKMEFQEQLGRILWLSGCGYTWVQGHTDVLYGNGVLFEGRNYIAYINATNRLARGSFRAEVRVKQV